MAVSVNERVKYSSPFAEKLVQVLDDVIENIRIIGRMTTVVHQLKDEDDWYPDDIEEAQMNYLNFQCTLMEKDEEAKERKSTEKNNLNELNDRILYYVKQFSTLDWEGPILRNIEPSKPTERFYTHFQKFRIIVIDMLTRTVKDLNKERKFTEKYTKLSQKNAEIIAKLKEELPAFAKVKDKLFHDKEVIAHETQERISLVQQFEKNDILYLRDKTEVKRKKIEDKSEKVVCKLREEAIEWQEKVKNARNAGQQTQKELKARVESLEKCIKCIIDRYDEKMMELQTKSDNLWKEFLGELKQCRTLCLEYEKIKVVASAIRLDKRTKYETEIKIRLEVRTRDRAAKRIQAFWRGILKVRKAHEAAEKKKGKGKKKKKKKKE